MIGHLILYFIIGIAIFAFNVVNNSYLPFLIFIVYVVVTILGIATLVVLYKSIDVEIESENMIGTRTEKFLVRYTIINKGFLPLITCRLVTLVTYNGRHVKKKYKQNIYCGSYSKTECEFYIDCPSCEIVTIDCIKANICDYLGLLCIAKKIHKISTVIVMPKLPPIELIDKMVYVINEEDGVVYSQERPGDDQTEIFAIREYVQGDNIRKIHWKLSTKSDKLMVKDFGLPIKDNDNVIIDIFAEKKGVKSNLDDVFDLFYGLVYAMTKRGVGFNACIYKDEYVVIRVENQSDIYGLFATIYNIKPYDYEISAAEYFYSNRKNNQNRMFYVTGYLNEQTQGNMRLMADAGKVYYLIPGHVHNSYMPVRFEG